MILTIYSELIKILNHRLFLMIKPHKIIISITEISCSENRIGA
jgi:hypothetical protein